MKVIRRNEETNDIDEKSPFLERSIPVTRSPKVSGAGVQLSRVLKIYANIFEIFPSLIFFRKNMPDGGIFLKNFHFRAKK